jgi:hypothetical protein
MTPPAPKVVLQAHATRSVVAMTLLLHGRERGPLQRRSVLAPMVAGLVLTILIMAGIAISVRVATIIASRG